MILVNGATGMVGSAVVSALEARGAKYRVFVRDPKKVAHLPAHVERAEGSLENRDSLRAALKGVSRVFVLSPELDVSHLESLIGLAKEGGVKHLVKLSTLEAAEEKNGIARWHRAEEKMIEASGLAYTFVRPGNFSSNALHWSHTIRTMGKVFAPTGDGKTAPIHPDDIGAVAAAALVEDGHEGKAHRITGPALLDAKEQTEILSRVLEKPLVAVTVPVEQAAEQVAKHGAPMQLVAALIELWSGIREGHGATITRTVEDVLHRPAKSFAEWARENRAKFA